MNDLLLHPETLSALNTAIANAPHAIMFTGNEGSGKLYIARKFASEILQSELENHNYFLQIEPDGKSISIDQIRELQKFVRLKTTGTAMIRRLIILADAHTMTVEAQNALLKLLEEPPEDTVLILTAQNDKSLKPTIKSRVQKIHIKPITRIQAVDYASTRYSTDIERAYNLSGGDIGLFLALLEEADNHKLASAINIAKKLLTAGKFERLVAVEELSKNKEELTNLLTAMKRISTSALKQSASKSDTKLKNYWLKVLKSIYATEENLPHNPNTKLLLTNLFLSI